jgi:hypothetical protein
MGCSLSPIIAEKLVQHIFELAKNSSFRKPRILKWFVDDSFLIIKKDDLENFFMLLNSLDSQLKDIKFTKEIENTEGCLSFLDLNIKRIGHCLETSIYRKPTHSNRYLNFNSYHSLENKKSVIRTLINRAFTHISNPEILNIELEFITNILKNNNYPNNIIKSVEKQTHKKYENSNNKEEKVDLDYSKIISIPYIRGTSEKIRNLMSSYDYKIVYKKGTNINNLLRENSSKSIFERNNVVYNLNCGDFNRVYTGETKRKLETRIKEHKNAITKPYMTSHVVDHARETKQH